MKDVKQLRIGQNVWKIIYRKTYKTEGEVRYYSYRDYVGDTLIGKTIDYPIDKTWWEVEDEKGLPIESIEKKTTFKQELGGGEYYIRRENGKGADIEEIFTSYDDALNEVKERNAQLRLDSMDIKSLNVLQKDQQMIFWKLLVYEGTHAALEYLDNIMKMVKNSL